MSFEVEVQYNGAEYTASVDENLVVRISRDGVFAGKGEWAEDHVESCDADLGDEVYDALDAAIKEAVGEWRHTHTLTMVECDNETSYPVYLARGVHVGPRGPGYFAIDSWVNFSEDPYHKAKLWYVRDLNGRVVNKRGSPIAITYYLSANAIGDTDGLDLDASLTKLSESIKQAITDDVPTASVDVVRDDSERDNPVTVQADSAWSKLAPIYRDALSNDIKDLAWNAAEAALLKHDWVVNKVSKRDKLLARKRQLTAELRDLEEELERVELGTTS